MARATSRRGEKIDYWPGFVDALSTLLLAIIFVLSIFVLSQFMLSQELTGRDEAMQRLNRQLKEISDLLALERSGRRTLEELLSSTQTTLGQSEEEQRRLRTLVEKGSEGAATADQRVAQLASLLTSEKDAMARAVAQIALLNQQLQALRKQLAVLEAALNVSEKSERESQAKISELGARLNIALAQRVQELTRYRSEFFGRLRTVLAGRSDIRVVGDRFVFQSELFFAAGRAEIKPEALPELDKLAAAVLDIAREIPPDINWILRVDGHTDSRPISSAAFRSNWDLSAARAIAVVNYLVSKGMPANRVAATGFAEFQPLDEADSDEARQRNRRIEFKLTER
jgi:chemotaxis protein MotB